MMCQLITELRAVTKLHPVVELRPLVTKLHPRARLHPPTPKLHPVATKLHPLITRHVPLTELHPIVKLHPLTANLHPRARLHPLMPKLHPVATKLHPLVTECPQATTTNFHLPLTAPQQLSLRGSYQHLLCLPTLRMPTLSLKSFTPLSASSEFVALLIDPCEKKNHVINLVSIHQTEQSPMTKMLIMLFFLLLFFLFGATCVTAFKLCMMVISIKLYLFIPL